MEESSERGQTIYVEKKRLVWPWVLFGLIFLLLLGLLLISLGFNAVLLKGKQALEGDNSIRRTFSEILVEGSGADKIVLVPIRGVISFADPESIFRRESKADLILDKLRAARDDPEVKAVIISIDSPGGGITASDVIYHRVKELRESGKKVVALLGDLAASGGYYVACPADRIMASPTTVTGSIGVIIQTFNVEGLMAKLGLKDVTIKAGKEKDLLSPFRSLTPEERENVQKVVDELFLRFKKVVAENRHLSEAEVEKIAGGKIFTASRARELGLVDELGYREDAIKLTRDLAGLKEARVIEYRRSLSLLELFSGRLSRWFSPLNVSRIFQPRSPRLMYLWDI